MSDSTAARQHSYYLIGMQIDLAFVQEWKIIPIRGEQKIFFFTPIKTEKDYKELHLAYKAFADASGYMKGVSGGDFVPIQIPDDLFQILCTALYS